MDQGKATFEVEESMGLQHLRRVPVRWLRGAGCA